MAESIRFVRVSYMTTTTHYSTEMAHGAKCGQSPTERVILPPGPEACEASHGGVNIQSMRGQLSIHTSPPPQFARGHPECSRGQLQFTRGRRGFTQGQPSIGAATSPNSCGANPQFTRGYHPIHAGPTLSSGGANTRFTWGQPLIRAATTPNSCGANPQFTRGVSSNSRGVSIQFTRSEH